MNDFLARNSNIQPSRTAEMANRAVAEAQASGQTPARREGKPAQGSLTPASDGDIDQQLSSAAEVAEAQAKIAALLSEIDSLTEATAIDVDTLDAQISALLPRPTVVVPMLPASREVVERAVEIAESIRASALLSLAAQANVENGMAEGVLA